MQIHAGGRFTGVELVLRLVMIAMALSVAFVGYTLLTTPLAIPITIGLWLGAAGMLWLGLFGTPPTGDGRDRLSFLH